MSEVHSGLTGCFHVTNANLYSSGDGVHLRHKKTSSPHREMAQNAFEGTKVLFSVRQVNTVVVMHRGTLYHNSQASYYISTVFSPFGKSKENKGILFLKHKVQIHSCLRCFLNWFVLNKLLASAAGQLFQLWAGRDWPVRVDAPLARGVCVSSGGTRVL